MEKIIKKLEDAIGALVSINGIKYARSTRQSNQWQVFQGNADILLHLQPDGNLLLLSPLCELPDEASEKAELLEAILEANHLLATETFSLETSEQLICLKKQADIQYKNYLEIRSLIQHFGTLVGTFQTKFQTQP